MKCPGIIGLATLVLLASCHRWPSADATPVAPNAAVSTTARCSAGFRLQRERSHDIGPLVTAREARRASRERADAAFGHGGTVLDALESGDTLVIAYESGDDELSIGVQRRDGIVERASPLPSYGRRVAALTRVGERVAIAYGSDDPDALGFAIWDPRTGTFKDAPRRLTGLFPGGSPDVGGATPTSMLWHDGHVWIGVEPPSGCRHCPCRPPPYAIVAVAPGGPHTTAAMHADVFPRLPRCEIHDTFELRASPDATGSSVLGEVVPLHGRARSRATVRAVCKQL